MTKTMTGNSDGDAFRIGNVVKEIGLTRRGLIIATSERRVFDWL